MLPSMVYCATIGDFATWSGPAGARRLGAREPPLRHHSLEEEHHSPAAGKHRGSGCPTAFESSGWTETCRRCVAEEEIPKQRSGCPSANVINGKDAVEISPLQDASPVRPHLRPPNLQGVGLHFCLPPPPCTARGRTTTNLHRSSGCPEQGEIECVYPRIVLPQDKPTEHVIF
jgi:hypothetical protein